MLRYLFIREPAPDNLGRYSAKNRIGRKILCNHRPGSHDRTARDSHSLKNRYVASNPDIVADFHVAVIFR